MIDIEKEREDFEASWIKNGGSLDAVTFNSDLNSYEPNFEFEGLDADDHYEISGDVSNYWNGWLLAKTHSDAELEGYVVVQSQGLILTCEEILEVLEFGAPDLKIERTEYSEEQMSTEITIVHRDTGHSGAGIYAYCTDCPEEGAIKLGDVEAARGGNE